MRNQEGGVRGLGGVAGQCSPPLPAKPKPSLTGKIDNAHQMLGHAHDLVGHALGAVDRLGITPEPTQSTSACDARPVPATLETLIDDLNFGLDGLLNRLAILRKRLDALV